MKKKAISLIVLVLIMAMVLPVGAMAVETRTNAYISYYDAAISPIGDGKMIVEFSVTGTGTMLKIGASVIKVYDSEGMLQDTFRHTSCDGMVEENTFFHAGSVTFEGVAGESYYAIVTCYAQNSKGSGLESYITQLVEAE